MNVARILYPIQVLGPGNRIGIWLCGCPHHCEGCSNPELWYTSEEYEIEENDLISAIYSISESHVVDGFTFTGGEPFQQAQSLKKIIEKIKRISTDILVYSGYTLLELKEKKDENIDFILNNVAVLIDGKYINELNSELPLRGSSNQKIWIFDADYEEKYREIMNQPNKIQNFMSKDGIISVGIHKKGYNEELKKVVKQKSERGVL